MPLTDAQIRSLKPINGRRRLSDGGGLYIDVMPSGARIFRLAYRRRGTQHCIVVGRYPDVRLPEARAIRARMKLALIGGDDPGEPQNAVPGRPPQKDPPASPAIAEETEHALGAGSASWAEVSRAYLVKRRLEGAAYLTLSKATAQNEIIEAHFGDRPLRQITPPQILDLIRRFERQGKTETAHRIRSLISRVFRYAIAEGKAEADPAAQITDALVRHRHKGRPGLTDPTGIGKLMQRLQDYSGSEVVRCGLLLSAYLFPRSQELRGMLWREIDWGRQVWEIPGCRMKMQRDHVVPLPSQALNLLEDLRSLTGASVLVLPAPRNPSRLLSDATFNKALRSLGYDGDTHVQHGFRVTASTILNDQGWNRDWIERQLAHVEGNSVRAAYNKAEYLQGRARMMQAYADWLDDQRQAYGG